MSSLAEAEDSGRTLLVLLLRRKLDLFCAVLTSLSRKMVGVVSSLLYLPLVMIDQVGDQRLEQRFHPLQRSVHCLSALP